MTLYSHYDEKTGRYFYIYFGFEPRDIWVGLFWDIHDPYDEGEALPPSVYLAYHIYICLVPLFPLHFKWGSTPVFDLDAMRKIIDEVQP